MIFRELQLFGHIVSHFLPIARQHNSLGNVQCFQTGNGISTIFLDTVVDDDMSGINTVNGHMDNGTHMRTVVPLSAYCIHHFRITHTDDMVFHLGTNTMSADFLDIADFTAIRSLIRESVAQSSTNRMG